MRMLTVLLKRESSQRVKAKFSSLILYCLGKYRKKRLFGDLVLQAEEVNAEVSSG